MADEDDSVMDEDDIFGDEKPQKKVRNTEDLAIQNIMKSESGRDFMWKQLQLCRVFENIFDMDPIKSAYNGGLRQAGLQLEYDLKSAAPGDYMKMIQENIDG